MCVLKRAFLYVSRKWQQSLIILLVLIVVSTAALTGFSILKASGSAAANLRRQLGGTFSIEIDKSNSANMKSGPSTDQYASSYYVGEYLDDILIGEVMKTSGISGYNASTEAVANLKSGDGEYYNLIENNQNDSSSFNPHMARIQGWTSLNQCAYFANHSLEITQGETFTADAAAQAVISHELAEQNHIRVGDQLILEINQEVTGFEIPMETQECVYEIVGIFDIMAEQQINQYTSQRQMLQNWVFVDSRTLLLHTNKILEALGMEPIGYEEVTFSVNDPAEMDSIIKSIQENTAIDQNDFKIKIDNENYQSSENTLRSMDNGVRIMIFAIVVAGMGIIILLLSIWARSRIYETGVLLSMGKSKWEILIQRFAELMPVIVLAFGFSFVGSNIAANDVGNILLSQANERNSDETKKNPLQADLSISADNFDLNPVFSAPEAEELTVNISADIFAFVCAMELFIGFLSTCIAGIPVMSMKPKTILTKYE